MILDEVLGIVNKFIPDKTNQAQITAELAKLEIEEFKHKKGIITRAFHLVFPFAALVLVGMYIVEFYLRVKQYNAVGDWITISIVPAGLEMLVIIFLSLLMPKKLLEPLLKLLFDYLKSKIDYGKRWQK